MFIETIQERGYVLKQDIPGEKRICIEYVLNNNHIIENKKEVLIGNEKNKLVIQPIGIIVIEFLMKYFDAVFSYTYTKDLEDKLDLISKNENTEWFSVCEECTQNIKTCSKPITEILKNKYDIDEEHQILFTLNGPVISCKKTNETDNQQYKTISFPPSVAL